jgi:hypothetical protein
VSKGCNISCLTQHMITFWLQVHLASPVSNGRTQASQPPVSLIQTIQSASTLNQLQVLLEKQHQQLNTLAQLSGAFAVVVKLAAATGPGTAAQDPSRCLNIIWQQLKASSLLKQVPGAALAILLWTCGQDTDASTPPALDPPADMAGAAALKQQPSNSSLGPFLQQIPQQLLCSGLFSKTLVSLSSNQELKALAKPQRMHQLLAALLSNEVSHGKAVHPQELASGLAAAVTIRLRVSKQQQSAILSAFVQQLGSASAQDISMLLWSLGSCGAKGLNPEELEQLLDSFCGLASSVRPTQISNIFWALGTMEAGLNLDQQHLLVSSILTSRNSKPQHLSTCLWALAALQAPVLPNQLQQLLGSLVAKLSQASAKDVTNALWAAATLGASLTAEQLEQLLGFLSARQEQMEPQALEQVLWATAALGQPLSEQQFRSMKGLRADTVLAAAPEAVEGDAPGAVVGTPGSRSSNLNSSTAAKQVACAKDRSVLEGEPSTRDGAEGGGEIAQQQLVEKQREAQVSPEKPLQRACALTSASAAGPGPGPIPAAAATAGVAHAVPSKEATTARDMATEVEGPADQRNCSPDAEVIARVQDRRGKKRGVTRWGSAIMPSLNQQEQPADQEKSERVGSEQQPEEKKPRLSDVEQDQQQQQPISMHQQLEIAGSCDMDIDNTPQRPGVVPTTAAVATSVPVETGTWREVQVQQVKAFIGQAQQDGLQPAGQPEQQEQQRQEPRKHQRIEFRLVSKAGLAKHAGPQQHKEEQQQHQNDDIGLVQTKEPEPCNQQQQLSGRDGGVEEERVPLSRPAPCTVERGARSKSSSSDSREEHEGRKCRWDRSEDEEDAEHRSRREQRRDGRDYRGTVDRQRQHRYDGGGRRGDRRRDSDRDWGDEQGSYQQTGRADGIGSDKEADRSGWQPYDAQVGWGR